MTTEYEAITESEWKDLATTEITHLTDEEKDYLPLAWDEWIARVKRDAARGGARRAERVARRAGREAPRPERSRPAHAGPHHPLHHGPPPRGDGPMTTLYRHVLISSAEQAEALPVGTVVLRRGDSGPWQKVANRHMGDHYRGDLAAIGAPGLVGHTALVPIDAEVQAAKGEAWDEGYEAGMLDTYRLGRDMDLTITPAPNPYRETGARA